MPPRPPLSTSLRGLRCPQCALRTFSTSTTKQQFGPEHPRFIEVPEPPQQTLPYLPFIKGRLPIPRNVFPGKEGLEKANNERVDLSTKRPKRRVVTEAGSHQEWKQKVSEARRRNLREGLTGLRERRVKERTRAAQQTKADAAEKLELRTRPEREDERLTAPSHGLDLEKLLHGPLEDPTRAARLKRKARNLQIHAAAKRAERLDNLHTLYMNARTFIVTPQQLDAAIEEEFNKDFKGSGAYAQGGSAASMWNYGAPLTVQDMLNRANRSATRFAMEGTNGYTEINKERIKKIAEKLTGGKMDD